MAPSVKNPRRTPRVEARMLALLTYGSTTWRGWTVDFGPGGCLVEVDRPLVQGTRLAVALHSEELGARLRIEGVVAWARALRGGIAFSPSPEGVDARPLFRRLLERRPALELLVAAIPASVPLDADLVLSESALGVTAVGDDEAQLLAALSPGARVRAVAMRSRLTPDRFARALYMLLQKGVLSARAGELASPGPAPGGGQGASPTGSDRRADGPSRAAGRRERSAGELEAKTRR